MKLILLLLLLLTGLGLFEMIRHVYNRRRIPIRIHVNGSRGKSSVTRLIAAGLRAGGIRTVAKTTGSAASIIHADGSESPVRRRGGPNIREQLRIFRAAAAEEVQALVLECMAVRPDLQDVCEHRIVAATVGVITNVRPDHLEVQGPNLDDVAKSIAGTVPRHSHLITSEIHYEEYLAKQALRRRSNFTLSRANMVTKEELAPFRYIEFPENVSLALDVCAAVGVPRARALAGMQDVRPDPGALSRMRIQEAGKELEFINAFAANDPVSYARIWERLQLDEHVDDTILLMNIRADRQRRSKDLVPLFGNSLTAGHYVFIGEKTRVCADMLRRRGFSRESVVDLGGWPADAIWRRTVALASTKATVVGIGNIAGVGHELLALLRAKERRS
jgi:poly-gamma-glutamate synthase PgsB/CapB